MKKYLSNPELPFIKADFKGNTMINGQFSNDPWPDTDASFKNVLKWFVSSNPQKKEKKNDKFKLELIRDNSLFDTTEDVIAWLGHASFFIRINGINLLTDPVFTDLPLIKRLVGIPFSFDNIRNIDFILLSHCHRDHFDKTSLDQITSRNPKAKILAPLFSQPLIKKVNNKTEVQEAGWFQKYDLTTDPEIVYLPALHWHRRGANDFNEVLWGSFLIRSNNLSIYFAGDTAYGTHFEEIRRVCGSPDIALMPIGAYKPTFLMQKSHTSPEEAIQGFHDLNSKTFIPMHYGTYDLANEPIGEPIRKVREILNPTNLVELKVGEKFFLK